MHAQPRDSMGFMNRPMSRRSLFKSSAVAGAGLVALNAIPFSVAGFQSVLSAAAAAAPLDNDLDILNYALTLEHLEAAAYKAVLGMNVLSGRALTYFQAFGAHEQAHVDAITQTVQKLGGTPVQAQKYDFSSVPKDMAGIVKTFQFIEDVGASAYLGAAPSIKNDAVLSAALSIHAVEAEHAAALADIVAPGTNLFSPDAFAKPRTPDEVVQIVSPFFGSMPGVPATGGGGTAASTSSNRGQEAILAALGVLGVGAFAANRLLRPQTAASTAAGEEQE